ncbi:MAG: NUDIX domain-containing protein [Clostridiales bacterium]|nr:NUDIX domain-containing protein [Clostridiales bacterium]
MLGKYLRVRVVNPIGSVDNDTGYTYPLNYGCVYDYDNLNAFVMGIDHPVRNFDGRVIATLNPKNSGRQILILAPKSTRFIINDITKYINVEKDFSQYKLECLYESSCGAVVFRDIKGEIRYLLIKNKRSAHWGFPKGHIEQGETKIQTAVREVLEETGVHVKIINGFESVSKYKIQNKIEKCVSIFVGTTSDTFTSIQPEEISDYIWLTYERALSILKFGNDKNIIKSAHKFLNENNYI